MNSIIGWVIERKVPSAPRIMHYYDNVGKTFTDHVFIYDSQHYAENVLQRLKDTHIEDMGEVFPITYNVKRPVYEWVSVDVKKINNYCVDIDDPYIITSLVKELANGNIKYDKGLWYLKKEVTCES